MDCVNGLIGLYDGECPCVVADNTIDNTSTSGFYVTDEIDSILPLLNNKDCGNGSIWDILDRARSKAIRYLPGDLRSAIYEEYDSRYKRFSGTIGRDHKINATVSTRPIVGVKIDPRRIKSGQMTLKGASIIINQTATIELKVWDTDYNNPIESVTVNVTANTLSQGTFANPVVIDMNDCHDYIYVGYELPTGASPLNVKTKCCSFKPEWQAFISAHGVHSNDGEVWASTGTQTNGLIIDVALECQDLNFLCNISEVGNHQISDALSRCLVFASARNVYRTLLADSSISFVTLMKVSRESLYGALKRTDSQYADCLQYIAEHLDTEVSDCFTCKKDKRISYQELIV